VAINQEAETMPTRACQWFYERKMWRVTQTFKGRLLRLLLLWHRSLSAY
jgi:hypothetical protein